MGPALSGALSAVDIALWDIKGKHFDVPIWELLGGNCRDKIRLHLLGGGSTPETMYEAAKAAVEEGFTALKFDPVVGGFQDMTVDRLVKTARDIVAAAREGGGPDLDLIVEVHRETDTDERHCLRIRTGTFQPLFHRRPNSDRYDYNASRISETDDNPRSLSANAM